jgi:hypothetical protein
MVFFYNDLRSLLVTSFELISISRCLTPVQRVLLQLGTPIIDSAVVARHKRHARLEMLWHAIRWPLLGIVLLLALESLGGNWLRTLKVGTAGLLLVGLFTWLVSAADLTWSVSGYAAYRSSHQVPANVAALATALEEAGIGSHQIHVEHLKNDPILFIEEAAPSGRYDLVIW